MGRVASAARPCRHRRRRRRTDAEFRSGANLLYHRDDSQIGIAVDANVLIFARLRDELRHGKSLRAAVELGFAEAWPAIRDSSASTLITSTILFLFGNSFGVSLIIGFALTLGLGVLLSLFTAVVVTRTLLRLTIPLSIAQNPWMYDMKEAAGLQR